MQNISVTASAYPKNKDITLLSVKGFIDTNTAPEFEKTFQSVLGENKFNLIVDLKEVNYISSAGWGIFIGELKRIRSQKGNLFLASMSPEVTEAFELLEFNTILKSFPNVEEAVKKGFGKLPAGKGPAKAPADKGPERVLTENNVEKNRIEMSFEEPQVNKDPKKPHSVFRILLPWNWF